MNDSQDARNSQIGRLGLPGPLEAAHLQAVEALLPGGGISATNLVSERRFIATKGKGAWVQDESGNSYIDFVIGAGALILGHAHPKVKRAISEQVESGTHFAQLISSPAVELAQELVDAIPCAEKIVYTTTGSEATFYAMRIARAFKKRNKILKFEGGYHGNHDYALQSTTPFQTSNFPSGRADTDGIPDHVSESVLVCPYNDLEAARAIVSEHGDDIAAIIVEPMQRSLMPRPGFLQGLRELCTSHDLLLIFDEIVTGFRLALGGGQEYFNVIPDLATFGKIVGGGFPLGVVAGRGDILDVVDPARRGSGDYAFVEGTFYANPVACAAALATLRELKKPGVYAQLNTTGANFRHELQSILDQHDIGARILGEASVWQVLFSDSIPDNYAEFASGDLEKTRRFDANLVKHGLLVFACTRRQISMAHTKKDLEIALDGFDAACRSFRKN